MEYKTESFLVYLPDITKIALTKHVFKHHLIKQEHNEIMQYITITFNQRDARMLSERFATLPPYLKEIPTKKYLWMIQGLVSRSFQCPIGVPAITNQSLFICEFVLYLIQYHLYSFDIYLSRSSCMD
jgi:hypothetical protein